MEIIIPLIFGVLGAGIIFGLRNDTREELAGLTLSRGFWVGASLLLAAAASYMTLGADWVKIAVAVGLFGFLWTVGHGFTLRGPSQDIRRIDSILGLTMKIWPGAPGDIMGWRRWSLANFIRYCLPCIGLAIVYSNPLYAAVGPLIVACYWPIGHWLDDKLNMESKFIGAILSGFVAYAMVQV